MKLLALALALALLASLLVPTVALAQHHQDQHQGGAVERHGLENQFRGIEQNRGYYRGYTQPYYYNRQYSSQPYYSYNQQYYVQPADTVQQTYTYQYPDGSAYSYQYYNGYYWYWNGARWFCWDRAQWLALR